MSSIMSQTPSTLYRNIKRLFNYSPGQLIKNRRLELALSMLQKQESCTNVAFAVGYKSQTAFSRAFNSKYKTNPYQVLKDTKLPED